MVAPLTPVGVVTVTAVAPRRVLRRTAVGLADQVLSGASNVLMVAMVARSLSAGGFGSFSLSYAILVFVMLLSRAYFGTRLTLTDTAENARRRAGATFGAVLLLSPVIALVVAAIGLAVVHDERPIVIVVAVATPIVCLQDALRFASIAMNRPMVALVSDGLWTVLVTVPVLGLVHLHGTTTVLVWLGAALAAFATAAVGLRVVPSLAAGRALLRERHGIGESVLLGVIAVSGASLVVSVAASHGLGTAAVGTLRGASTLMGPLNVLFAFITLNLTPTLLRRDRARDIAFCIRVSGAAAVVIVGWAAFLLLLPNRFGVMVLGDTWAGTRRVLPYTCVEYLGIGVASATLLWLRVHAAAAALLNQRAAYALALVGLGLAAVAVGADVWVVSASAAAAALFSASLGWWQVKRVHGLERGLRRRRHGW